MPSSNYFILAGTLTQELNFIFRNFRLKYHTKYHTASKGCSERIKELCTHYSWHTFMPAHRPSKHKQMPVNEETCQWTTQTAIKVGAQVSLNVPADCRRVPSAAQKNTGEKEKRKSIVTIRLKNPTNHKTQVELLLVPQPIFLMWTFLMWMKALPFPRAHTSSSLQHFLSFPGGITDCCMFKHVEEQRCQESCLHWLSCLRTL